MSRENTTARIPGFREMPWEDIRRYYVAAIAGKEPESGEPSVNSGKSSLVTEAVVYLLSVISVGAICFHFIRADAAWAVMYAWPGGTVLGWLITGIDRRRRAANRARAIAHYLPMFEKLHRGVRPSFRDIFAIDVLAVSIWVGPFAWLAYRRMPLLAAVMLALPQSLQFVLGAAHIPTRVIEGINIEAVLGIVVALAHGPIMFLRAGKIATACLDAAPGVAQQRITRFGGTNRWSWIAFLAIAWCIAFLPR